MGQHCSSKSDITYRDIHGKLFTVLDILIVDCIEHIDGLVQDCNNFIPNALELPQSYANPSIFTNCTSYMHGLIRPCSLHYECDLGGISKTLMSS